MSRADIKAELEAFIKSGKAKVEINSGNFATTHIDPLKVAERFYEQAEKDFMENFKMWVAHNGYTAQESELVYNDFKQFITEN